MTPIRCCWASSVQTTVLLVWHCQGCFQYVRREPTLFWSLPPSSKCCLPRGRLSSHTPSLARCHVQYISLQQLCWQRVPFNCVIYFMALLALWALSHCYFLWLVSQSEINCVRAVGALWVSVVAWYGADIQIYLWKQPKRSVGQVNKLLWVK